MESMMRALLLLLLFIATNAWAIVGTTKGSADVTQGSLTYDIEILTPKGTAGVKPTLGVNYNSSSNANSILGVGFSLQGLSVISRCNETLFAEKQDTSRSYNYCLDGQKLLLTDTQSSYGGTNTEYKTEINNHAKILKTQTGWQVYGKDGMIYEYGMTTDSNDNNLFFKVNKITDRYNNAIHFTYYDTDNRQYIKEITYADNTINFIYEDRSDKKTIASNGVQMAIDQRIKAITTKTASREISRYTFSYEYSDNRSRIVSAQECSNGVCLEPVEFEWESSGTLGYTAFQNWGSNASHYSQYQYAYNVSNGTNSTFLDINGDGLPDRVHHYDYNTKQYGYWVQLNTGSGFTELQNWGQNATHQYQYRYAWSESGNTYSTFLDLNADGLPDRVHHYNYTTGQYGYWVQLNTGSGFTELQNWGQNATHQYQYRYAWSGDRGTNSTFLDINGDGLPDRVHHYNYTTGQYGYWVQLNTGSGFTELQNWGQNATNNDQYRYAYSSGSKGTFSTFLDINADGLPDRIHEYNYITKQYGYWVQLNTGSGFTAFQDWGRNATNTNQYRYAWSESGNTYSTFLDINGDGLPDRVHEYNYTTGQYGYWVQLNTGSGFTALQNWGQNATHQYQYRYAYYVNNGMNSTYLDLNADGLPDRVHHYNYSTKQYGYWVQLNTGSGFTALQNWGSNVSHHGYQYRYTWTGSGNTYSAFLDINADGLPDRVHHHNYTTGQYGYWVQLNTGTLSQITSITNHKDQDIQIDYTTLRDSSIYTPHTDASYPIRDIQAAPMSVVKTLTTPDGIGGKGTVSFKYEGYKVDLERGSLGFAKIETTTAVTDSKTIADFYQTFPYIGVVQSTESYIGETKLSQSTTTLATTRYFENQAILNIETTSTSEEKYDLDGTHLLTTYTINSDFDRYGNIGTVQTTTEKGETSFSKITTSLYDNDEEKWILSRLESAMVTHIDDQDNRLQKTSAFLYDETTGILTDEVIEPGSTKQLAKSYTYDANGNKISEIISGSDIPARETKYLYDGQGKNIIKVINPLGHTETRSYDINNNLISMTGPNNLTTSFEYDAMGRKTKESRADGTTTTWSHTWESSIPNALYKVTEHSTGTPPTAIYYDRQARKIRTVNIGFDGSEIYEDTTYNAKGLVAKVSTPHYAVDAPEYLYHTYDALGRQIMLDRPGANGSRAQEHFEYSGLDLTVTDAKGHIKTTRTNIIGQKIQVIEGDSTTTYRYDPTGNLIQTTDADNNTITIAYDLYGNKTSMDDPDMGSWSYNYNALGELISQTDAKNQTTTMEYDLLGRMTKRTESEGETVWTYDRSTNGIGKLSYTESPGYRKEFYYDPYGRVNTTKEHIDQSIFETAYSYQADGKLQSTTSPDGFITVNEYNDQGYLAAIKTPKSASDSYSYEAIKEEINNNLERSLGYARESVEYNNQASEKRAKAELFAALANATEDAALQAQLLETASLAKQTALLLKVSADDALEESKKALDRVTFFLKEASRFRDIEFYEYVTSKFRTQTRFYIDLAFGNLNSAIATLENLLNDSSITGAHADKEKAMITAHIDQTKSLILIAQSLSQKVKNYKVKHKDAVNKQATHASSTYLDMLENEYYRYFYKVIAADQFGRVTKDIVGNGLITTKAYNNANGHLNTITTGYNSSNDIRDIVYTYDELDNVTQKQDNKQNITASYTYDSLNRINSATIQSQRTTDTINYTYDKAGNILSKSDVGAYTYDNAHQVTAAGSNSYTYDANGNVIQKNETEITYSSFNKPTQIKSPTHTTRFFYGPDRARYKKTLGEDTTYYSGKLFEKEIKGTKIRYKNFIYAGTQVVAIDIEEDDGAILIPTTHYLHYDSLGSVDTITNESGEVIQRVSYKPFGERIIPEWQNQTSTTDPLTKRGFTGHEHIEEHDLIHMNGRIYDPTIGRFLSADPHIQAPYDTQSYNRYSYVMNNPLKYTDPSGFFFKSIGKVFSRVWKKVKNVVKIAAVIVAAVVTAGAAMAVYAAALGAQLSMSIGMAIMLSGTATSLGLGGAIIAGAAMGFGAGFAGGLVNGASIGQSFKMGLNGAKWGAISGGVAFGVAELAGAMFNVNAHGATFFSKGVMGKAGVVKSIMHGLSRMAIAKHQYGTTKGAFLSGLITSGTGGGSNVVSAALIGGTVSEISGGKFANGAVGSAFQYMFNDSVENIEEFVDNLTTCAAEQFGLQTILGAGATVAGAPIIPKDKAAGAFGSTKKTSLISKPLREAFPQEVSKIKIPTSLIRYKGLRAVTSIGAGMARGIPVVGEAILIYDGVCITNCVIQKY
jgi:RHS repeat-associated protein